MSKIEKDSFVVVSDFHSISWPLEVVVNKYFNEYDKIYILGDATDRGLDKLGSGGIDLLLKIKQLTDRYPEKVIYIPGNHDEFLYGYAADNDEESKHLLHKNGGDKTIDDIDKMKYREPEKLNELMEWLGNLPLQREHLYRGKRFVMAHALFNNKLFRENPYFSLKDYRKSGGNKGEYLNLLWYRKRNWRFPYDPAWLPKKGDVMVIGHTPLFDRGDTPLDLENAYGNAIEVYCVDGGVSYNDPMLSFAGANTLYGILEENNEEKNDYVDFDADMEKLLKDYILKLISGCRSVDKAVLTCINSFFKSGDKPYFNYDMYICIDVLRKKLEDIYMKYCDTSNGYEDYRTVFKRYFIEVALEYITEFQWNKDFPIREEMMSKMEKFLESDDPTGITEFGGYFNESPRDVAIGLGSYNIKMWLAYNGFNSYEEYLNKYLGEQYRR